MDVIGKTFEDVFDCAVDEGRLDAVVEVEPKQLRNARGEVEASEQVVARFVGHFVLQERGIHLS